MVVDSVSHREVRRLGLSGLEKDPARSRPGQDVEQTAGLLGRWPVRQQTYRVRVVDGTPKLLELGAFCRPESTLPLDKGRSSLSH